MRIALVTAMAALAATAAMAHDTPLESAVSAAPDSLSDNATVMTWDGEVLRQGSNGWVCLPNRPDNGGNDPWCVDDTWMSFLEALMAGEEPSFEKLGIGYMLAGDAPVSNIRPDGKKEDGNWVEGLGAHLMILVPDRAMYDNVSTDPFNGGPWIMWPGTPYEHLMVPIDSYPD